MSFFSFLHNNKEHYLADAEFEHKLIITGTTRDYSALKTNDVALKIWLPESVNIAIKEMSSYTNTTNSDLIRQTLFTYLYGRYDLMASIEKGEHDFALNSPPVFSRRENSENRTPELGKNTYDEKVWIAKKMKNDLQELADKTDLALSHFIREILISNLFGHTYLYERNEMINFRVEFDKS